jgi:hypothetical protein
MTVVIALKDMAGNLLMGADKNMTAGYKVATLHNPKIWRQKDGVGNWWMFGVSGNISLNQVIRYRVPLPTLEPGKDEDPVGILTSEWMPQLYKGMREIGAVLRKDQNSAERPDGGIILGLKGEIYSIAGFSIAHLDVQFHTIGSGGEVAFGALHTLIKHNVGFSPEEMIHSAIATASAYDPNIGGGVDIISSSE